MHYDVHVVMRYIISYWQYNKIIATGIQWIAKTAKDCVTLDNVSQTYNKKTNFLDSSLVSSDVHCSLIHNKYVVFKIK